MYEKGHLYLIMKIKLVVMGLAAVAAAINWHLCPVANIKETKVLNTFFEGKKVFGN